MSGRAGEPATLGPVRTAATLTPGDRVVSLEPSRAAERGTVTRVEVAPARVDDDGVQLMPAITYVYWTSDAGRHWMSWDSAAAHGGDVEGLKRSAPLPLVREDVYDTGGDAGVLAAARAAVGHLRRVGHWDVCDLDALARAVDASPADTTPASTLARAREAVLDAARARAAAAAGADLEAKRVTDRALHDLTRALLLLEAADDDGDAACSCTPLVGDRHARGCELYDGWAD